MSLKRKLFDKANIILKYFDRRDVTIKIGKYYIDLPYYHSLPYVLSRYPRYDSFLYHISKFLDPNTFVIDVGANCGYVLSGMISENKYLNFICIEADKEFFNYLSYNISRIKKNINNNIILSNSFIGNEIKTAYLEGARGSKNAKISSKEVENKLSSIKLDKLLSDLDIKEKISLLKIDVDGFDYDIINSATQIIKKNGPLIFFECDCETEYQRSSYIKTIKKLEKLGYTRWAVFDNFGAFLFQSNSTESILDILNYIWEQDLGISTRTFNYVDILCSIEENKIKFNKVITSFK